MYLELHIPYGFLSDNEGKGASISKPIDNGVRHPQMQATDERQGSAQRKVGIEERDNERKI